MRLTVLLILFGIAITSCSSLEYNTKHQASTLRNFQKQKHGNYVPTRKRSDVMHPAVTKATRKNF
jgi:hypothetical protein